MFESLTRTMLQWRWVTVILVLALTGVAAKGMQNLMETSEDGSRRYMKLANDFRVFFDGENPQLTAFEKLNTTYTKNDNVMFVLAPKSGTVFDKETLQAVEWLTEKGWKAPFSLRVDSITNFQHTRGEADDLIVEPLVKDAASMSDEEIAHAKKIALAEPLMVHRLISETGHTTAVNVTVNLPKIRPQEELPLVAKFSEDLQKEFEAKYPNIAMYRTGISLMNNAFPEASMNDMKTLYPLMFLVVSIVLYIMLRSVSGSIATVLIVFMSIFITMGLAGWMNVKMTPPAAIAPIVIMTLAVADCVHILEGFFHNMRGGMEKRAAMVEAMRINFGPVFLTSLTTAVGFLTMNSSDTPPFRDLGNLVAIGVAAAWFLAMFFLPALMMVLPVQVPKEKKEDTSFMETLGGRIIKNEKILMISLTVATIVLGAAISKNEINDEFVKYFDETIKFRTDTDFVTQNLTGIYMLEFSLPSKESGGINEPEYLNKMEEYANWFRTQPEVIHVNSLTDIVKRLNKNLHGDDPAFYAIPAEREMAAQYMLLYEMSLPYGMDLNNQIDIDKKSTRFSVTLENITSNEVIQLEEKALKWQEENLPEYMRAGAASPSVMFAHIGFTNAKSMMQGSFIALALISVILMVALRSFKIGLISLIPNMVPAIMAFGVWGMINGQINMAIAMVVSMTLGIVVDDTIHFLSKYLRYRREENCTPEEAIAHTFKAVGNALWVTSVVLIAGFLILALSAFEMNAGMGLLTAITIAFALAADFFYLPPILLLFDKAKKV